MGRTCHYTFFAENKKKAEKIMYDFEKLAEQYKYWYCETPYIAIRAAVKVKTLKGEEAEKFLRKLEDVVPKNLAMLNIYLKSGCVKSYTREELEKYKYERMLLYKLDFRKIEVCERTKGYEVYGFCKTEDCDFDVLVILNIVRKITEKHKCRAEFYDEGEIFEGEVVKGKLKGGGKVREVSDEIIRKLMDEHLQILEVKLPKNLAKYFRENWDDIDYCLVRLTYYIAMNTEDSWEIVLGFRDGKLSVPNGLPAIKLSSRKYPFATVVHKETMEKLERFKKVLGMTSEEVLIHGFRALVKVHGDEFKDWILEMPARYEI